MTDLVAPLSTKPPRARVWVPVRLLTSPARLFGLLSLAFGTLLIILTPPLRGPDEAAHFLRAYGIAQGEVVPLTVDREGRKGIRLPACLHDGFAYFEATQAKERTAYGALDLESYARKKAQTIDRARPPVFVRYEGSEGYAPVAYLPHVASAQPSHRLSAAPACSTELECRLWALTDRWKNRYGGTRPPQRLIGNRGRSPGCVYADYFWPLWPPCPGFCCPPCPP